MSATELYKLYESQGIVHCSRHEDGNYDEGHLDIGGMHYDYPHSDFHTDE